MTEFNKEDLVEDLKARVVTVTFTKKDGSERVMKATLLQEHLPPRDPTKETKTKAPNPDVVAVWDTESKGWRSINIDSITKVE